MFYQKYRPQNFSEVFGNELIVKTLVSAIVNNKLPHSLLFYGPRGTGKTTSARLVAKMLNCTNITNNDACKTCESCIDIANGSYPDVIELDAASNNSVENIRYINDKIALSPSRGKIKLYIIDEVHMLSKGAFNALLKTLEEPPKNTYFILATTEIEKVIDTIKSRCTIFEFKPASTHEIVNKLKYICESEKLKVAPEDLVKIADASRGGFRDAETLLETMVIGNLTIDEVLNSAGADFIVRFFDALLDNNTSLAIELINKIYKGGKNLESLNKEILSYLRQILLLQNNLDSLCQLDANILKLAKNQSGLFTAGFLIKCLKSFNVSLEQIKYAFIQVLPLEIAVYEITKNLNSPAIPGTPTDKLPTNNVKFPADLNSTLITNADSKSVLNKKVLKGKDKLKNEVIETSEKNKNLSNNDDFSLITNKAGSVENFNWAEFLKQVLELKPSLFAVLNVVDFKGFKGNNLILETKYAFHKERLEFTSTKTAMINILNKITQANCNIVCTINKSQDNQNLTDKNIEYVTVSEADLPVVGKQQKPDNFDIPLNDESFVASDLTIEQQLKKQAKQNLNSAPVSSTKSTGEEALDSFSGDFAV